ncbi:MAG: hypothetical protein H7Z18_12950 [Methylophilaceae bacterium]|nr:hypothetical protein [Methylophilaceae bacterium]
MSLFWESTNQTLYQHGLLNSDTIAIGVPLNLGATSFDITDFNFNRTAHKNSNEKALFCGTVCKQDTIQIFSGTSGFEFISLNKLVIDLIVVSRSQLMPLLAAEDQFLLNLQCQEARIAQIPIKVYQHLVAFLNTSFELLKSQPQLMQHADFRHNIASQATGLVIESLLAKALNAPTAAPHKSWQVFCNTRDMVNVLQDNQ